MVEHKQLPVHIDFRDQISRNKTKSFLLMLMLVIVILLLGYVIANVYSGVDMFSIMILAIIFSVVYSVIGYYSSGRIAVASVGAKEADRTAYRDFYRLVEGLTIASGLPMPKLYVMPSLQINAFASGRDPQHAIICVTEGALAKLDKRELEGVLAHELSHVGNYDIRFMTITAVMVGVIAIISEIFLRSMFYRSSDSDSKGNVVFILIGVALAILAPIVTQLVQMAISRKREYSADAMAVQFTRYPNGLIGALKKIQGDYDSGQKEQHVSKAVAPLFFASPMKKWLSTHPAIDDRIRALESM